MSLQTKFFAAQHKVKEELEMRYKSVVCLRSIESPTANVVIEQYDCKVSDLETERLQAQFTINDGVEVKIFKLQLLASHKI